MMKILNVLNVNIRLYEEKVRMFLRLAVPILIIIIGIWLVGTANAADVEAGKAKSATCAGCHGVTGISSSPLYPNLAGQKEQYLMKSISAYRGGERGDPTMKAMTNALTDTDIENLAAFYSSQSCK